MSSFFQALDEGYPPEEILKYLSKAIPKMSEPIRKATKLGYNTNQILGFLAKNFDTEDRRGMSETERHAANRRSDAQMTKYGLTMAASSVVAPLAVSAARSALSRALPNGLKNLSGSMNPIASSAGAQSSLGGINSTPVNGQTSPAGIGSSVPMSQMNQGANQVLNASQQPPVNQVAGNIPQVSQPQQPKVNFGELLTKHNAKSIVDDLMKSGNGAETVSAYFKKFSPQFVKDIEKEAGDSLENVIGRYAEEKQNAPQEQKSMEPEGQKLDVPKESGEVKKESPKYALNDDMVSKYLKSKSHDRIGSLGEFFKGSYLRDKFKDVLDVQVYRGSPSDESGGYLKSYEDEDGTKHIGDIVVNPSSADMFDILVEEATHALRLKKGRGLSGEDIPYDERKEEISAKKHIDFLKDKYKEEKSKLEQEKVDALLEKRKSESKPISKNETVASPQGIGEVREIRGDKALVEVDGKLHKVDVEDLEGEPEEVKNAKFDFDLADVPEDLRSAPLNEVYTPADRRHVTVKYNAGLKPVRYLYYRKDGQPLSENYVNKIKEGIQLPVSSGMNFWGVWDADKSDSRGATNYKELVANAQEESTPDDPSKEYWFVKEEAIYEHPYMELKGKKELRELEKKFNEERKKRKKKAT